MKLLTFYDEQYERNHSSTTPSAQWFDCEERENMRREMENKHNSNKKII